LESTGEREIRSFILILYLFILNFNINYKKHILTLKFVNFSQKNQFNYLKQEVKQKMLIEFSVENFRSIKEKVTLSMVASSDRSLENNLIESDVLKKDKLLKSAVLYGANASGKSNVLLALNFLEDLVTESHKYQKGDKIDCSPFKLDAEYISKPSKFEVVFIEKNIKYIYGVSVTYEKIVSEYLYYYPKGKKALIFERSKTNDYKFSTDQKTQEFISERTLENVLYLSKSTQENFSKTSEAFNWFKDTLEVMGPAEYLTLKDSTVKLLNEDPNLKAVILTALLEADLGINDVSASIEKIKMSEIDDLFSSPPNPPATNDLENLNQEDFKDLTKHLMGFLKLAGKMAGSKEELETSEIKIFHKALDKEGKELSIPFDFNEESEGTQKLFSLIGLWIDALLNGRVLVVDELDVKLHYRLNEFLIKLFNDPTQNKSNAQLIFTTHNTNTLNLDLFRRDQIWFTEKNPEYGNTDLYSLAEFNPRKDENIQKGYLLGRYGAIPFIKENKIF